MSKETSKYIRLGIFVTAGVSLLVIGLYFIGSYKNIFGSNFRIAITFRHVNGLKEGNNVRFSGIDIGTVDKITVKNDSSISVEILVDEKMKNVIRQNSVASIGTDGLMGDKLVNIDPGTNDVPLVEDGGEIRAMQTVDTEQMLRTLEFTNKNIAVVSANLKDLTESISRSKGTLYTIFMDTTLAESFHHTLENVETVSNNLTNITGEFGLLVNDVKQGKGFLGSLVKDTGMTSDLKQAISRLKSSSEKIFVAAGNMQSALDKINSGGGAAGAMISDTATANNLKMSIQNIEAGTKRFNEVMEALQHSFLLRGYFKKQEKNK